jgi:hypothetical protein
MFAVQRWEGEGGALAIAPGLPPRLFRGRETSGATRLLRLTQVTSRKRMQRAAWFVGLGLLVLVLLNISGVPGLRP